VVLCTDEGKTLMGLATGASVETLDWIACSIVGLYNVLSGVDYVAVDQGKDCLIRRVNQNVELVWKHGNIDTLFRLTIGEYKDMLNQVSDGKRGAA
jgi:hypothetical protein